MADIKDDSLEIIEPDAPDIDEPQDLQGRQEQEPENLTTFQKWAVGRPKKVTPQLIARIAYYLRQGNTMNDTCVLAGIGKTALYANLKANEEYRTIIAEAWTQNKQKHIKRIDEASKKDAKFSEWYLERRYPEEFGQPQYLNFRQNNTQINFVIDDSGFIPKDNVQGFVPTLERDKPQKPTK